VNKAEWRSWCRAKPQLLCTHDLIRPNSSPESVCDGQYYFLTSTHMKLGPSIPNRDSLTLYRLGCGLDNRETVVRFLARVINFSFLQSLQPGSGAAPPPQKKTIMVFSGSSIENPLRNKSDHSYPCRTKFKNESSYISNPSYAGMVCTLVQYYSLHP